MAASVSQWQPVGPRVVGPRVVGPRVVGPGVGTLSGGLALSKGVGSELVLLSLTRYVRFETIEEAQRVLQSFGTAEVDGVMYAVAPAREGMPRGTMKPMLTKSPVDRHDSANSQQWNSPPPGGRGMQASGGRGMLEASTIKPSPPLEEATPTCPPLEEATPTCPLLEEATPTCPPLEDSTSGSEVSDASTDEWDETLLERLSLQGGCGPLQARCGSTSSGRGPLLVTR